MKRATLTVLALWMVMAGCQQKDRPREGAGTVTGKDHVVVELRSGTLVAFDLPSEGVRYRMDDFEPGMYRIPLKAIRRATEKEIAEEPGAVISVDTGTMYIVDAEYYERLREIESRMWEERKDDYYDFLGQYDAVVSELGVKFNYVVAPGVDSGYDFVGDGSYVLDTSLIERIRE